MKKVILVTGASSGIGLACANALQAKGHTVYGSSRDIKRLSSVSFKPIEMDVSDNVSVNAAVDKIIKAEGKIEVLVNNAGNGVTGPAYAMPVESARTVSYTHLRAHETGRNLVCRLLLEKKKKKK